MIKQMVLYVDRKSRTVDVGGSLTVTYTADRDECWVEEFIARLSEECQLTVRRTDPRDTMPLPG